ncbi:MAG: penicillin-binding protein, partial [Solirubrobacteraceae bacterium]|nr:penicillin-binding protein [Solirubrobacteraceae bacterium]
MLVVVAAIGGGAVVWRSQARARDDRHAAAVRFVGAWERGDRAAMWRALSPHARATYAEAVFTAAYRRADRTAGVESVRAARVAAEQGGKVSLPVVVGLRDFGSLRGTIALPLSGSGGDAGVDWRPSVVLPGLRPGERVRRRAGQAPRRAPILAADGTRLNATALGASVAGVTQPSPTGLERVYDRRLAGHPSARLLFGRRTIARTRAVAGRSLHTTLRPGLMRAAQAALGDKAGGVAVIR